MKIGKRAISKSRRQIELIVDEHLRGLFLLLTPSGSRQLD